MPRCVHCGRVNREDALFCQNCGNRLAQAGPAGNAEAVLSACPKCAAPNPEAMNFCKMCGGSLRGPAAASPPVALPDAGGFTQCAACWRPTPSELAFCQNCGARQTGAGTREGATTAAAGNAPPAPRDVTPVPGALRAVSAADRAIAQRQYATVAGVIATKTGPEAALPTRVNAASSMSIAPEAVVPLAAEPASAPALADAPRLGRLLVIRPDGSEGDSLVLRGDQVDIGRSDGDVVFAEDRYLAARHARLEKQNDDVVIVPLDNFNGVFRRVREAYPLAAGDVFLVGKEVFRFDLLEDAGSFAPCVQHGVTLLASPPRQAWARVSQLLVTGVLGDVMHLCGDKLVVGREEGDLCYPDDSFLSRQHAQISRHSGRAELTDLGSSNGTFVRLTAAFVVSAGDQFRLGNHLLRYEAE